MLRDISVRWCVWAEQLANMLWAVVTASSKRRHQCIHCICACALHTRQSHRQRCCSVSIIQTAAITLITHTHVSSVACIHLTLSGRWGRNWRCNEKQQRDRVLESEGERERSICSTIPELLIQKLFNPQVTPPPVLSKHRNLLPNLNIHQPTPALYWLNKGSSIK